MLLGTDPMVVDGMDKRCRGKAGEKKESRKKAPRFSRNVGNERDDAGRDRRICLARPNSQARTGTEEFQISLFS